VDSQGRVLDPQGSFDCGLLPKSSLALASNGQDFMLAFLYSLPVNPGLYVTPVSSAGVALARRGFWYIRGRGIARYCMVGDNYLISYNGGAPGYSISAARVLSDGTVLDPQGFEIFWANSYYKIFIHLLQVMEPTP
jgi:hypothetical protein